MKPREAAVLFDSHLGVWELWHRGRRVVHSVNKERVLRWADTHNYKAVLKEV